MVIPCIMKNIIKNIISILNLGTLVKIIIIRLGFRQKIFEQRALVVKNMYKNLLKPGMLVFDIGANQGHYTAGFLLLGSKVISVEPQKDCFKILRARFRKNKNVHLLNCACDAETGEKMIHISNMNTISSMSEDWISAVQNSKRFPEAEWKKTDTVKAITLESLKLSYGQPDFIKIDVEGYELNVLMGLKSKVPLISIEYTFEIMKTTLECLEYLSKIGEISVLADDSKGIPDKGNWMTAEDTINFITEKKDQLYRRFINKIYLIGHHGGF
jgi:FkbM family methyltransferase